MIASQCLQYLTRAGEKSIAENKQAVKFIEEAFS